MFIPCWLRRYRKYKIVDWLKTFLRYSFVVATSLRIFRCLWTILFGHFEFLMNWKFCMIWFFKTAILPHKNVWKVFCITFSTIFIVWMTLFLLLFHFENISSKFFLFFFLNYVFCELSFLLYTQNNNKT